MTGRLALLAAVLTTAGCSHGSAHELAAAQFPQQPGWQVGTGHVHACPGMAVSRCAQVGSWATTGQWRDCTECLPQHTVAALPSDGVAISLLVGNGPDAPKQALRWPPRLRSGDARSFEGLPARIGTVQRSGVVHGLTTYLFVFFGRPHPTPAQLRRAQAELASAKLP